MLNRLLAKLTIRLLKNRHLSGEDKTLVTTALLESLDALPLRDVITFDVYGTIKVGGKSLTHEDALTLRESAHNLRRSYARKLVHEQVLFEAVKMGVHQGLNPDMILFSKAAIWYAQEENKILEKLDVSP